MNQADFKPFVEILNEISDYYRRDRPTAFTIKLWWESLKEFELEAVQRAFIAHINRADKDGKFMPQVSSLRELMQGSTSDSASAAWIKVTQGVQRVGTGCTVVFDDPLIHRVVEDVGGWVWLGQQSTEEWQWVGKTFEARYRAYAQRGERPPYPPKLIGHFESNNGSKGLAVDPPVLIGDPEKAKAVLAGGSDTPRLLLTTHVPVENRRIPAERLVEAG